MGAFGDDGSMVNTVIESYRQPSQTGFKVHPRKNSHLSLEKVMIRRRSGFLLGPFGPILRGVLLLVLGMSIQILHKWGRYVG